MARKLQQLSEEECLALLAQDEVKVGRLAVSDARPTILPVNYALVDERIVFRSAPGTKLDFAAREAFVAFEVDAVEAGWERGWSVVIRGQASEVRDPEMLDRVNASGLHSWAAGDRDHVVQIDAEVISGRRLV